MSSNRSVGDVQAERAAKLLRVYLSQSHSKVFRRLFLVCFMNGHRKKIGQEDDLLNNGIIRMAYVRRNGRINLKNLKQ